MHRLSKKRRYLIMILFVLLIFLITILAIKRYENTHKYSGIPSEEKLYSLGTMSNEKELEKKGYINLSDVQQKENKKITKFFQAAKRNEKSELKVFKKYDNELFVKIFYSDPKLKQIRGWTYEPLKQASISPDKRFSTDFKTIEEKSTITIILVNVKDTSLPIKDVELQDEELYTYLK